MCDSIIKSNFFPRVRLKVKVSTRNDTIRRRVYTREAQALMKDLIFSLKIINALADGSRFSFRVNHVTRGFSSSVNDRRPYVLYYVAFCGGTGVFLARKMSRCATLHSGARTRIGAASTISLQQYSVDDIIII